MSQATVSDRELVGQVLGGQRDAFTTLTERYISSANAVARARLGRAPDSEDAVQEAFLRAFERLGTLRDPAKFGPWLLTIARHEAIRLAAARSKAAPLDDHAQEGATDSPDAAQREMNAMLRDHISQLPETSREVLLLHYFAGQSAREIATLLEIRRTAVLKRLQRAREQLAETLLRDLEAERPSEASLTKQVARIAALASAATLPAAVSTSAIAATLTASVLTKVFTGTAVVLLGATLMYAAYPTRSSSIPVESNQAEGLSLGTGRSAATDPELDKIEHAAQATSPVAPDVSAPSADPAQSGAISTELEASPEVLEILETRVTLEASRQSLASVLTMLEQQFGLRFLIDNRAVGSPVYTHDDPQTPQTLPYLSNGMLAELQLSNVPLSTALDMIARELGLAAVREPGFVWISSRDRIVREVQGQPRSRFEAYADADVYNTPIRADLKDIHLSETLELFQDAADGANIAIDFRVVAPKGKERFSVPPPGKVTDGVIEYINLKNVQLTDTLRLLCRMLNLAPVIRSDHIWLSSPDRIRTDGLYDVPAEQRNKLDETLRNPVSIVFEDIHMNDVLDFLAQAYSLNILFDQRVTSWNEKQTKMKEPSGASSIVDERETPGLSHGMLYDVVVHDLPLRSFIEILTRQLGLNYRIQGDTIVVSSPDRLSSAQIAEGDLVIASKFPMALPVAPLASSQVQSEEPVPNKKITSPRLYTIQTQPDGWTLAQIDTGRRVGWYKAGQAFEDYVLERIDTNAGCVTLLNEKTDETFTISIVEVTP